jgi:hypothetical protein
MATPIVAGVVAQLLQQNPRLTAPEIKELLQLHAKLKRVQGVPNHDRGLAMYSGIDAAPCILETDQECVFIKGLVRNGMLDKLCRFHDFTVCLCYQSA